MSIMVSTRRNATLFGLIVLFALTVLFFIVGGQLFYVAAVFAIIFGILGLLLVVLTLRLHEPKIQRRFFFVTGVAAAGIPISVVLHNLVYALCMVFFGEGFWKEGSDEPFFFILAIIVCPALFVIGAVGSMVVLVRCQMTKSD